jgi:hypothetical protein
MAIEVGGRGSFDCAARDGVGAVVCAQIGQVVQIVSAVDYLNAGT